MLKETVKHCKPTRGTKYSACVDLYAKHDCVIDAGGTELINLGVCIDLDAFRKKPMFQTMVIDFDNNGAGYEFDNEEFNKFMKSHYLQLMLRSSLGKKGLILPNGIGIIDLDYRDEIKMIIHNPIQKFEIDRQILNATGLYDKHIDSEQEVVIKKGDRIAQVTLLEHKSYLFGVNTDVERDGGFGSTGDN